MRKIISAILAVAILVLLFGCAESQEPVASHNDAAVHSRAPGAWGISEFIEDINWGNSPVSEQLGESGIDQYIQTPQMNVELDNATFYLDEALFDGRQLHAVFTVKANPNSNALLITSYGYSPEDTIFYADAGENQQEQTFADKAATEGKRLLYISVLCRDSDAFDGIYMEQYHTDGSVTIYLCQNYMDISEAQRALNLEFKEYMPDTEEAVSDTRELQLVPCGVWEKRSAKGAEILAGASVSAEYYNNRLEAYITVRFDLSNDLSPEAAADWYTFYAELSDLATGDIIPELGSGIMMFDPSGDAVEQLSAGDSVVFFMYLQADTLIPENIQVSLVRQFGDGSDAGKTTFSFS